MSQYSCHLVRWRESAQLCAFKFNNVSRSSSNETVQLSLTFLFTSCVVNLSAGQWREVNGRSEETLENLISDRGSANRSLPGKQQAVNDHVCVGAVFLETVSRGMWSAFNAEAEEAQRCSLVSSLLASYNPSHLGDSCRHLRWWAFLFEWPPVIKRVGL